MKNTINKIIICLLAVILVMPISPILTQAESVFDVFDPERYVVIQNIVREKMQEYGELEEEKWPGMSYSKGLVYVDLVDFNEDLIPELVLAYCDKSATSASEYVVEVWDCTDIDNPTCAVQETGFSMDMDRTSVCIVESLEKNYLLTGTMFSPEGYKVYGMGEDGFYVADRLDGFSDLANAYFLYLDVIPMFSFPNATYKQVTLEPLGYFFDGENGFDHLEYIYNHTLRDLELKEDIPNSNAGSTYVKTDAGTVHAFFYDFMFDTDPYIYRDDLCGLSVALSGACYDGDSPKGENIYNALIGLGFEDNNISLFSYPGHKNNEIDVPGMDSTDEDCAFAIASMNMGDIRLMVVAIRGTQTLFGGDGLKDLSVDSVPFLGVRVHKGFGSVEQDVENGINYYLSKNPKTREAWDNGSLRILITGHSLGAGAANLLGARLNAQATLHAFPPPYVYTFATPRTYNTLDGTESYAKDNRNIFNIIDACDMVPKVPADPNVTWLRFGEDKVFDSGLLSPMDAHAMPNYYEGVSAGVFQ